MLNSIISALAVLLVQDANAAPKIPEVNKIQSAVLEGSYSCDDSKQFGLDVTNAGQKSDQYDLLINSVCDSPLEFQSGIRGSGLSLIADIGEVRIEDLNFYKSLAPTWEVGQSHNFRTSAPVKEGHAYSVVINNGSAVGFVVVKVDKIEGDKVFIRYAVRHYALIKFTDFAKNEDPEAPNK